MINSCTSFGKLKECIVGVELEFEDRKIDTLFNHFFQENLGDSIYQTIHQNNQTYSVSFDKIEKRNESLDNLSKLLESLGVKVYRPDKVKKLTSITTPTFKTELSSPSNVRDITICYGNKLIETPVMVRNRYFENINLYNVYNKITDDSLWIKAPHTTMLEENFDLGYWKDPRDFNKDLSNFCMAIDGACFLRIGKDCIVNISTYNQYNGFQWVKKFFPEVNFHMVKLVDNHIDGTLICLKPGVFLINPKYKEEIKKQLPSKFKNWKLLEPTYFVDRSKLYREEDILLASFNGMDINVLSIDENNVVVDSKAFGTIEVLEKNGFNVHQIDLYNSEIFAGGVHCSTLDTLREDEMIFY